MKKILTLSLCCFTVLTASARNDGPDETVLQILSIIFLIFGVLNIILFFKIWGMTNDVKKIKDSLAQTDTFSGDSVESKVRLQLMNGDREAARRLILAQFASTMDKIFNMKTGDFEHKMEFDISEVVQGFKSRLQMLDLAVPEQMNELKTLGDYYKIYNPQTISFKIGENWTIDL